MSSEVISSAMPAIVRPEVALFTAQAYLAPVKFLILSSSCFLYFECVVFIMLLGCVFCLERGCSKQRAWY